MAINQLNDYSVGDASIDGVMVTLDATRRGHMALTLTQMDTNVVPAIAAGSVVEVGGALFEFTTDEALTGSPSDGTVYIKLVPSGSAPTITLTPTMTNTAPVWVDAKQGWYGETTSATHRYVARMYKISTAYYGKKVGITGGESYEEIATENSTASATFVEPTNKFSTGIYASEGDIIEIIYKYDLKVSSSLEQSFIGLFCGSSSTGTANGNIFSAASSSPFGDPFTEYQHNANPIGGIVEHYLINSQARYTQTTSYKTFLDFRQVYVEKSGLIIISEAFFATSGGTAYIKNRSMRLRIR
jgi:hypothetical protein